MVRWRIDPGNVINALNSWTDTFRKSSKFNSQNMRGLDHATIPIPSFHGLRKERLAQ